MCGSPTIRDSCFVDGIDWHELAPVNRCGVLEDPLEHWAHLGHDGRIAVCVPDHPAGAPVPDDPHAMGGDAVHRPALPVGAQAWRFAPVVMRDDGVAHRPCHTIADRRHCRNQLRCSERARFVRQASMHHQREPRAANRGVGRRGWVEVGQGQDTAPAGVQVAPSPSERGNRRRVVCARPVAAHTPRVGSHEHGHRELSPALYDPHACTGHRLTAVIAPRLDRYDLPGDACFVLDDPSTWQVRIGHRGPRSFRDDGLGASR